MTAKVESTMVKTVYIRYMSKEGGAFSGFCSMKCLRVFLLPLEGMLVHYRVVPSIMGHQYPFIHLGGERHCQSVWPKKTMQCRYMYLHTREEIKKRVPESTLYTYSAISSSHRLDYCANQRIRDLVHLVKFTYT